MSNGDGKYFSVKNERLGREFLVRVPEYCLGSTCALEVENIFKSMQGIEEARGKTLFCLDEDAFVERGNLRANKFYDLPPEGVITLETRPFLFGENGKIIFANNNHHIPYDLLISSTTQDSLACGEKQLLLNNLGANINLQG